jgi:hypothetical protein
LNGQNLTRWIDNFASSGHPSNELVTYSRYFVADFGDLHQCLIGLIEGEFQCAEDFPEWLKLAQSELAEWLRTARKSKSQYFLAMANLESYQLSPHARSDPRDQFE